MKKHYKISVKREFSAAHRLTEYDGKCEQLHGHNWTVEVQVASDTLDFQGMVMDFHDLKECLDRILEPFDHAYLNECACFQKKNPTSEHIAEYIFDMLALDLQGTDVSVCSVSVWETRDNCAIVKGSSQR